ncbi:MAG: GNAT family N-acetyltransferase [Anaerolineae bacterium]
MYYNGNIVRLRPPEREDLPLFVEWLSNPEMRNYLTIRYISHALEEQWFERLLADTSGGAPDRLHFVIETLEETPRPIGVISLENINWRDREAEVGITVGDSDFWGRGYGTDAMRTMLEIGFRWFNLHRIFLRVIEDNTRAVRSYEKCGFHHEGRLREAVFIDGEYKDTLVMGMLAKELPAQ